MAAGTHEAGVARGRAHVSDNARHVLELRYLVKDEQGQVVETAEQLFGRVAQTMAAVDARYGASHADVQAREDEFFNLMVSSQFMPNSPTLMNAGRPLGQLSACFVLPVPDDMSGIYDSLKACALIHQSGGGTGFAFSDLRPSGDTVRSTQGVASGPVSFMKVFNASTDVIKQGGKRRGANMGVLHCSHPDIMEFITCKDDLTQVTNFNISVAITNQFMQALQTDDAYPLINPRTGQVVNMLRAREVWDKIVQAAWKTGEPGVLFIDRANAFNPVPHLGAYKATNPCVTGDTRLHTSLGLVRADELYERKRELQVTVDTRALDEGKGTAVRPAVPVFMTSEQADVYRVETHDGYTIRATAWHDFYTQRGKIKLSELQVGDQLLVQSGEGQWGQEGDYVTGALIGMITGDGNFNKVNGAVISLWGDDRDLATLITNYVNDVVAGTALGKRKEYQVGAVAVPERNLVRITSSRLARALEEYGFSVETKHRVPEIVWRGSRHCAVGYLRALFQCDGTVNVSNEKQSCSVRLASSYPDLLRDVQALLSNFGVFSSVRLRREAGQRLLPDGKGDRKLYDCQADYELIIDGESRRRFMAEIGFLGEAKNQKYAAWADNREHAKTQSFTTGVTAIVYDGLEPVYDTTQADHNTVIFNGLVTGQCGEQWLLDWDVCNLGSINVGAFVTADPAGGPPSVDWAALGRAVQSATRFLDNVIDANQYPLPEISDLAQRIRRIGLGIMGWADLLIRLELQYMSPEAEALAEELMRFVDTEAKVASLAIADERGVFPEWERSIWGPDATCARDAQGQRIRPELRLRNCNVTTIAPTGTISMIADCSSGCEPLFGVTFMRNQAGKYMKEVNQDFVARARAEGWHSDELIERILQTGHAHHPEVPEAVQALFQTAHDITPEWHVRTQAAFQKFVDSSISKTTNFPRSATPADVEQIYLQAYATGCKGVTVYRDGSREDQVLSTGATGKQDDSAAGLAPTTGEPLAPPAPAVTAPLWPEPLPHDVMPSYRHRIDTPMGKMHVHVTVGDRGEPLEMFATIGRAGSETLAFTEGLCRMVSVALRTGIDPAFIVSQLNGIGGGRAAGFGPNRVRSVPDALGKILAGYTGKQRSPAAEDVLLVSLQETLAPGDASNGYHAGELCPSCGHATFVMAEGCAKCHTCGHAEC